MALDLDFNGSTEDTVREVIGITHDHMGFDKDTCSLERIVSVLDNAEFAVMAEDADENEASDAAVEIREILWNRYSGGGASAAATCSLFHALGRENELGWVVDEGNYNEYNRQSISKKLAELRLAV